MYTEHGGCITDADSSRSPPLAVVSCFHGNLNGGLADEDLHCQVEEIALTCVILQRADGVRQYCPISKLSTNILSNLSRSACKKDKLTVGALAMLLYSSSLCWQNAVEEQVEQAMTSQAIKCITAKCMACNCNLICMHVHAVHSCCCHEALTLCMALIPWSKLPMCRWSIQMSFKHMCIIHRTSRVDLGALQWLVDARTPAIVLKSLIEVLKAHHEANPGEFKDPPWASFTGAADPMKVQLSVSYELTHNGAFL